MRFGSEELSFRRLAETVDAARECGFAAVSANDHFVFSTPWLDGPTALASVIERSGEMTVATTISLAVLRGPVPLAKMLAALDVLSEGRLIAGLGPGSSKRDYDALGIPFDERWKRFDEAITVLRELLKGGPPESARYYRMPSDLELAPSPRQAGGIPLWIGSWGSKAGLRRIARAGDGWLASAYNTTPDEFSEARGRLADELADHGRNAEGFPNALATMWTWVSRGSCRPRSGARRDPRAAFESRSGQACGAALHRLPGALRRHPLPVRGRGMPARLPLAGGRRATADRAGGERCGSSDRSRADVRRPPAPQAGAAMPARRPRAIRVRRISGAPPRAAVSTCSKANASSNACSDRAV